MEDFGVKDLTKEELNKQIVLMRNVIKRTKVHLISSLVQKSRKLKSLAEKKPGPKTSGKHDRILSEINEIKKLKADTISKHVLTNEVFHLKSLKVATPQDRALVRYSEHKFIKNVVETFRAKYPKWAVQVPSLYNIWDFQNKIMKKRKHANEDSKSSVFEKPCDITPRTQEPKKLEKKAKVKPSLKSEAAGTKQETSNDTKKESLKNVKDEKPPSLPRLSDIVKAKQPEAKVEKLEGDMVVKVINLQEETENDIKLKSPTSLGTLPVPKSSKKEPSLASNKQNSVKSSLFLDMEGNELLDLEPETNDNDDNDEVKPPKPKKPQKAPTRNKQFSDKKKFKPRNNPNDPNSIPLKPRTAKKEENSKKYLTNEGLNTNNYQDHIPKGLSTSDDKIHPSWAAKRKQRLQIFTNVQAKKIKFDDDDD